MCPTLVMLVSLPSRCPRCDELEGPRRRTQRHSWLLLGLVAAGPGRPGAVACAPAAGFTVRAVVRRPACGRIARLRSRRCSPDAVRRAAARCWPCSCCRVATAAPRRCAAPATSSWLDEVLSCRGAILWLSDHTVVKDLRPETSTPVGATLGLTQYSWTRVACSSCRTPA